VAFLIGIKTSDMAEVFCVEQRSILQSRHRLKQKLKAGKDLDLHSYLKQIYLYP